MRDTEVVESRPDPEPVLTERYSNDGASAHAGAPEDVARQKRNAEQDGSGPDTSTSGRSNFKRDEAWEARRRYNNMRRREKAKAAHKAKVAATRAAVEALQAGMTPEQLAEWQAAQAAARAARAAAEVVQAERVAAALACGGPGRGPDAALRIAIDCSFSPSAPPKEMRSLCKQIENASSINKHYPRPACLTLTHWGGSLASVAAPYGAAGWRVVRLEEGPAEAFGAGRAVVLSPDAAEPLLDVDAERCAYVIGGIVDRTVRKGLTLKFAEAQRVDCRRLPIAEHAEALGLGKGTRKCPVLNIDDVVKALLIYHDTRDWVRALDAAIPARKRKPQTMGFTQSVVRDGDGGVERGAQGGQDGEEVAGAVEEGRTAGPDDAPAQFDGAGGEDEEEEEGGAHQQQQEEDQRGQSGGGAAVGGAKGGGAEGCGRGNGVSPLDADAAEAGAAATLESHLGALSLQGQDSPP